MAEFSGFQGILADLARLIEGRERVPLGEVLDTLGARGHGPIVLLLAALMMMPTGLLPLMPTIIGVLLALTAIEIMAGGKGVSLPGWIAKRQMPVRVLRSGIRRARPMADRLRRYVHPRWHLLVHSDLALWGIALLLLMSALIMAVIGAVPGLPFVLCIPALLFGIGLTAGDGLVVALGFLAVGVAALFLWWLFPQIAVLWPFG